MAKTDTTTAKKFEFKASHRYARSSPRKARLIADLVRGRNVNKALEVLLFEHKRVGHMVEQLIHGAIQNANQFISRAKELRKSDPRKFRTEHADIEKEIDKFDVDNLYLKEVWVDEGPRLKRWLPRAMGRATPIIKRMCHINVVLGYRTIEEESK